MAIVSSRANACYQHKAEVSRGMGHFGSRVGFLSFGFVNILGQIILGEGWVVFCVVGWVFCLFCFVLRFTDLFLEYKSEQGLG